ncbi:MAG TPA: S9 family peptidase, partial [bacterium]|nr:S9 family peptidase [bacterium]
MVSLFAALVVAAASGTHPFNVRDMQALDRVEDPVVSPDGKTVVFTVLSTDVEANKRSSSLWRVGADGSGARRLTAAPSVKDANPVFAPDGKTVYFLSNRSQSYQVWKISLEGGEAERVTDEPLDVSNLRLSPDGTKFGYSMDAFPDCADAACTKKRLDEKDAKKATGQIFDSLLYRHWDTWSNGTRQHLFVRAVSGGPSVDVMKGMDADSPSKPFGGAEEFTFTPDSKSIVFSARNVGREEAWSTNFDLFLVPADGSAKPVDLTADNPAWDTHPMFSPDGKTLAWLAQKQPGYESDRFRVTVRAWPNGATKTLTEKWEGSPDEIGWSHDGKSL